MDLRSTLLSKFSKYLLEKDFELCDRVQPLSVFKPDEDYTTMKGYSIGSLAQEGDHYSTDDFKAVVAYWDAFLKLPETLYL